MTHGRCRFLLSSLLVIVGVMAGPTQPNAQEGLTRVLHVNIIDRAVIGDEVEVDGGGAVLRVTQGDAVEIHWSSGERTTLHLHGYGIEIDMPETGTAVMSFDARATGRFPVQSHDSGDDSDVEKTLLYLEVHPR